MGMKPLNDTSSDEDCDLSRNESPIVGDKPNVFDPLENWSLIPMPAKKAPQFL